MLEYGNDIDIEIKINNSKYKTKLQKSPMVIGRYDPLIPSTCIFDGYLDKLKTPITVLGCPSSEKIEVNLCGFINSKLRFTLKFTLQLFINSEKLKHTVYQFKKDGYSLASPRNSLAMLYQNMTKNDSKISKGLEIPQNARVNPKVKYDIPKSGFV